MTGPWCMGYAVGMTHDFSQLLTISPVKPDQYAAALYLVLGASSSSASAGQIASMMAAQRQGKIDFTGLLGAFRGQKIVGAAWANVQAGKVSSLWPAEILESEPEETATQLHQAALDFLSQQDLSLVQALVNPDKQTAFTRLEQTGLNYITDLCFMLALAESFPEQLPESCLQFTPYSETDEAAFAQLVAATYSGSADCPELDGKRNINDTLTGYQASGQFDPNLWYAVSDATRQVGCLLLAPYPESQQTELVYCGILPEARGQQYGKQMVHFAQYQTKLQGHDRLVLAVDQRNTPAINIYDDCGFVTFETKRALVRFY
ncbi:MAG: GNAT family N-acetyltransferase [Pirellulales bacterium]